jgi:hypothetical protein
MFLLASYDGLRNSVLRGTLIAIITVLSWVPVTLLHNGRSFARGIVTLMPIAREHYDNSNFGQYSLHSAVSSLPSRWLQNAEQLWGPITIEWSGVPFSGQVFRGVSDYITTTIPYLVILSGLLIFLIPRDFILRRFVLGAFVFLAFVTIFHAVGMTYISVRMRAVYAPLWTILAGIAVEEIIRILSVRPAEIKPLR